MDLDDLRTWTIYGPGRSVDLDELWICGSMDLWICKNCRWSNGARGSFCDLLVERLRKPQCFREFEHGPTSAPGRCMALTPNELAARTKGFADRVLKFVRALPYESRIEGIL